MKSGVTDFIEKPFESDTILSAVHRALEAAVSRDTLERQRAAVERRRETLTEREQQVLALVTEGYLLGRGLNSSRSPCRTPVPD